ncbi:dermonecrotic toxin domain-containing protein [Pandoraea sp. NPDC087047]|uniref:dermonecrotic toxin domain-containing protein n=1 Tax=Pandoraea sp. NPDC087047 TaxID=3364390 RepID=UPI00380C4693
MQIQSNAPQGYGAPEPDQNLKQPRNQPSPPNDPQASSQPSSTSPQTDEMPTASGSDSGQSTPSAQAEKNAGEHGTHAAGSTQFAQAQTSGAASSKASASTQPSPIDSRSAHVAIGSPTAETLATLQKRKRSADASSPAGVNQAKSAAAALEEANMDVQHRLRGMPSDDLDFSRPDNFGAPDVAVDFYTARSAANRTKLNDYWNESLTINGATDTRKSHVAEAEKTLLSRSAALGVADGDLSREDQTRIDRLRTYPKAADREGQASMPGVYSIAGSGGSDNTKVDFSGMYVITQRPAAGGELTPSSDVGTAMLVVPGQPIVKRDSMQALTDYVESRLNNASERNQLLNFVDADKHDAMSKGDVTASFSPIAGNVFTNRLESQITRQIEDLDDLAMDMSLAKVTQEQAELRGQKIADSVRANGDMAPYVAQWQDRKQNEQNLATLKAALPDWLKAPPGGDSDASSFAATQRKADWEREREKYLGLAEKTADKQIEASNATSDVLSLDDYTDAYAKGYLTENGFPGVNPGDIQVKVTRSATTVDPVAYQTSAGVTKKTTEDTMSLPEYLRRNNDPTFTGSYTFVSVKAFSADGQPMGLNVTRMASTLDVGENYTKYLKDSFFAPSSAARRDSMQQADRAMFEKDISQARLQRAIGETQDKRGTKWAEAILNHPDPASRPKVDGYTIEASRLRIGGEAVANVYVIGPTGKQSMGSVLLYTPDAPHGKTLREFSDRAELSRTLKSDALRDHLLQRVDPGAKGAVNAALSSRGGAFITERPVTENFFNAMYQDRVNRAIINADRATTSNSEVGAQSAWNAFNWGLDFLSPIPIAGQAVNLGQAGVGFMNSAEAARNGDAKAAKEYLFDAVTRVLSTDAGGIPRRRSGGPKAPSPSLNPSPLPNGKTGYQFSENNAEAPSWKIPTTFGVAKPRDIGDAERGVYSATRNGQKHEYVQMDGQFYESGQNGKGRYIQRPGAPTERMQIVRADDKWQLTEPPARGLLGGGNDTPGDRLTSFSNRLQTHGIANSRAFSRVQPELNSYLAADANRTTFTRLVDLAAAEGRLSLEDRAAIREESTPYRQAESFTNRFLSRNGNGASSFPHLLSQAERNGPRARLATTTIGGVAAREHAELTALGNLATMDAATFGRRRHDISTSLSLGGNHETFNRLVDLATAEGQLGLADRAAIMRQPSAYERASAFTNTFLSRNGANVSNFPDLVTQAQSNGPRATAAPTTIRGMIEQERSRMEGLPGRLTASGPFDSAGLTRHRADLINLLTADSTRGVQDRFLDTLVANGSLGVADRYQIGRIRNDYERGSRLLDAVHSRVGNAGLASVPDALRQAIARTPGATTADGPLGLRASAERSRLAGLPGRLSTEGIADTKAFRQLQPELASYLAESGNQTVFNRLLDLSVAEGRLGMADRDTIMAQSGEYRRASRFAEHFLSRNGNRATDLPDLLSQAVSNGPRASSAPSVVNNMMQQQRTALAGMPTRMTTNGSFDSAGMTRHRNELIGLLTADSNRGVHDRLLDILVADGSLGVADRFQIGRIQNAYERGSRLLETVQSRLGNSGLARFPAALERAVEYDRWRPSAAVPEKKPASGQGPAPGA